MIQGYGTAYNIVKLVAILDFRSNQVLVVENYWTVGRSQLLAFAGAIVTVFRHRAD